MDRAYRAGFRRLVVAFDAHSQARTRLLHHSIGDFPIASSTAERPLLRSAGSTWGSPIESSMVLTVTAAADVRSVLIRSMLDDEGPVADDEFIVALACRSLPIVVLGCRPSDADYRGL